MSIIRNVLDHLNRHGNDMAIVDIDDVHARHDTVFDFITECQRRATDTEFTAEFIRPSDRDDGSGDKIILMANPGRITEHNVLDTRIYIVEQTTNLKQSLIKYRVSL
jgi:hypothetical protein